MTHTHRAVSSIEISEDLQAGQVIPLVGKHVAHFSSVEDEFFSQGDALSTGCAASTDDMTATRSPRSWLFRRRSLTGMGVGVGVIAATVLLVRSGGHAQSVGETAPVVAPQPAAPAPLPVVVAAPLEAPSPPAPIANPAVVSHEPDTLAAPAPTDRGLPPSPALKSVGAGAAPSASEAFDACKRAFDQHHGKDILAACAQAFAEDPTSPSSVDAAVMLAKTEFDRGRAAQALSWAKKAIALDANRAEAYVFVGGAEQAAGHNAAAKAAYKRYLQLSPQGRYAGDLRAVLAVL